MSKANPLGASTQQRLRAATFVTNPDIKSKSYSSFSLFLLLISSNLTTATVAEIFACVKIMSGEL